MISYYLSTADEATMKTALLNTGVVTMVDNEMVPVDGVILDIIGECWSLTGNYLTDANGQQVPESVKEPYWYFNVYSDKDITWPSTVTDISPATPWRVLGY